MNIWNRTDPSAGTDTFFYPLLAISLPTLCLCFIYFHVKTASLMLKQLNFLSLCFKTLPSAFRGSKYTVSDRAPWCTWLLTPSEIFSRIVRQNFFLQKPCQLFPSIILPCCYSLYFILWNSSSYSWTSGFLLYSSSDLSVTLEKKTGVMFATIQYSGMAVCSIILSAATTFYQLSSTSDQFSLKS